MLSLLIGNAFHTFAGLHVHGYHLPIQLQITIECQKFVCVCYFFCVLLSQFAPFTRLHFQAFDLTWSACHLCILFFYVINRKLLLVIALPIQLL